MNNRKRNVLLREIKKDWRAIRNCSEKCITTDKMIVAIEKNPKSIQYFPETKITKRIILRAVRDDYSIFNIIPISDYDNRIIETRQKLLGKPSYIRYLIKHENFNISDSYYSKDDGFAIILHNDERYKTYTAYLKNFYDFAEALCNDFKECNLLEYDFKDVDFKKYNFENAYISAKILKKYKVFDESYYYSVITQAKTQGNNTNNSLVVYRDNKPMLHWKDSRIDIKYISDLHLAHRIKNHFKKPVSKNEIYFYIKTIVSELFNGIYHRWVIFDGDLGIDFELNKVFLTELSKHTCVNIIFVLGNHELFGLSKQHLNDAKNAKNKIDYSIDNRVRQYEKLCKKLGIHMLQNKVLIIRKHNGFELFDLSKLESLTQKRISKIRKQFYDMEYAIFGTCGFSYLNKEFNYKNSLWGINAKEEKHEFVKANNAYNNLKLLFDDKKVIVVSHTPITDWINQNVNSNWIYITGHTHRNMVIINDTMQIYADNQIGYFNNAIGLKSVTFDMPAVDIFYDYADGLYEISKDEYIRFNQYQGISTSFNKKCKKIIMIKSNGYYCFLVKTPINKNSKEKLYLLDGGRLKSTKNIARNDDETIENIKNNIFEYTNAINKITLKYDGYQKQVASFIRSIGGYGKIHGCIIDVDEPNGMFGASYNHIYVNPNDGKLTCYYAYTISERFIYKDLPTMLKEKMPNMFLNYKDYLEKNKTIPTIFNENNIEAKDFTYDEGTYIYKQSQIMKKLQYITENKVIRIWDNSIVELFKQSNCLPNDSKMIDFKIKQ